MAVVQLFGYDPTAVIKILISLNSADTKFKFQLYKFPMLSYFSSTVANYSKNENSNLKSDSKIQIRTYVSKPIGI